MKCIKYNIWQAIVTTLLLAGFLTSCSDTLRLEPKSVITVKSFWKTENDVKGALNGMYSDFRNANKMMFQLGEGRSEVLGLGIAGSGGYDLFYNNTLNPNNLDAQGNYSSGLDWRVFYTIVNSSNLLIKYVPSINFASEEEKNRVLAEAYTMRAFIYFLMAKTWGDLPLRTDPIEGYDANTVNVARSPVNEIFSLIKSDIEQAMQLYPDNQILSGRYRWSKVSANALKADVYLWTGKLLGGGQQDFETALAACNEVAAGDTDLLENFNDIFRYDNKGNREVLMSIRFQLLEETPVFSYFRDMYMFGGLMPSGVSEYTRNFIGTNTGGGHSVWAPTELVRNQFNTKDSRRLGTFYEIYNHLDGDSTYFTAVVMKGTGAVNSGNVREYVSDIIVYRFAEVLLMKAEAKNALGMDPSPELNQLRARAFGEDFPEFAFRNADQLKNDEFIISERLLELMCEGKRWWDLIRFRKAFELVPSLQGKEAQQHLLLFPIPTKTLSLEPLVVQNPGWEN
ncbi:MAG: RagB/SusD family nutrient uptake outer membrane protein [Parapedobacter sp.]|nr:MAG: RagB/SusD family nutrient uptake outer membrane protein [Parapedobacter sp.]